MTDVELRDEPYDGPVAQTLIDAVQLEYVSRYGGPDTTPVDPADFAPPLGRFVVAYLDNAPVGAGGLRLIEKRTVEVKRMYVVPDARGRGLARLLLLHLESLARGLGATRVLLETGTRQPEAMSLYETSGYRRIEGFGHYKCEPDSISYAKDLV